MQDDYVCFIRPLMSRNRIVSLPIEFRTPVASAGYEWVDGIMFGADEGFSASEQLPQWRWREPWNKKGKATPRRLLRPVADVNDCRIALLDDPALFRNFANIDPYSDQVITFANRYGLLWESRVGVPFGEWEYEIRTMEFLIELWESVRKVTGSSFASRPLQRFGHIGHPVLRDLTRYVRYGGNSVGTGSTGRGVKRPNTHEVARDYLIEVLNARLMALEAAFVVRSQGKNCQLGLQPRSLLAVMWFQFAQAVCEQKYYRQCEVCRAFMEISLDANRADRRTCSNACRNRALRIRQKSAQQLRIEGKSLHEIAKALGSTEETVKGWLKDIPKGGA